MFLMCSFQKYAQIHEKYDAVGTLSCKEEWVRVPPQPAERRMQLQLLDVLFVFCLINKILMESVVFFFTFRFDLKGFI